MAQADVRLLGTYGLAGLIIRANDEEEGVDAYHGYTAGLADQDNVLFLGRADYGWRGFVTKTISPRVFDQQWYHIKFLAYECVLAVSTRTPSGQTTAASFQDPDCIPSGRFGLRSYNTGAEWRNVEVRPATRDDLIAMIGNINPATALPLQSSPGADAATSDRFSEPLHRDLLEHSSDVQALPIRGMRLLSPISPTEVTVHGVVTLTSPTLFIQDATGGLAVPGAQTRVPLQIGDEVEAKGYAELPDFSPVLQRANVRLLWSHSSVAAVSVTASEASTGIFDSTFVDIQGKLIQKNSDAYGRLTLTLEDGDQYFLVIASAPGSATTLRHLKQVSRLRLHGICTADPAYTHNLAPFAILLPSAGDLDVIKGPPWWSAGHIVAIIIGALVMALAGLSVYILIERWRLQAILEERGRLAHEMHDTLAQSFAGLGFQLEAIYDDARAGSTILPQLDIARGMVRSSHEEARRSIAALRPEHLESIGLLSALESCTRHMIDGDSSVRVRTILFGSERAVPLRISDTLFRIGQEAIANAIRHARPTTITLSLAYRPSRVELIIEDDGFGFQVSSASAGFGIRGMTKRAETIAARFTIRSAPGEGSAVHVVAPLQPSWLRAFLRRIPWRRPPRPEHFGSTIS
jgi:signal transduction histidine kinase